MATVLVVDDVLDDAQLLERELTRQGYRVETALGGAEALGRLAQEQVDAILLDLIMPEMDGLETCRRLRADERFRSLPVIMVASCDSHDAVVAGFEAGADDCVSRHGDPRVWIARLRNALRLKASVERMHDAQEKLDERRRLAEAANAAKGEFLANFSHELRSPMTAIMGFAEVLREKAQTAEERATIATIRRNGETLLRIIDELLDLSKIEAGRFTIEIGPCSPRAIVNEVIALLALRAEAKNLSLSATCDSPLPDLICSDALRLRQILVNLVGNAVKFTEEGGVLISLRAVKSATLGDSLLFEIADTGIGIEPERIEAIFHPYAQADSSVARRYGGSGLGLTISRRLAQMLGGDISVVSAPGFGSKFTLALPANSALDRRTAGQDRDADGARPAG